MSDQATGRGVEFTAQYGTDHAAQYFRMHLNMRARIVTRRLYLLPK